MTQFAGRIADHPVEEIFLQRWSPRAFTGEPIPAAELMTIFEAARWAPSSYNSQPWRYVYARRDTPAWERLLGLLVEGNRAWAKDTAVLMVALSKATMNIRGKPEPVPSHSHSFDAGAAWANLALQATRLGWHAHGMVGFDQKRAASELDVPEGYRVEAMIAIGRKTAGAGETPNGRNPVGGFAFEGKFNPEPQQ